MTIKKIMIYFISLIIFSLLIYAIIYIFDNISSTPFRLIKNEYNLDLAECDLIKENIKQKESLYTFNCPNNIINKLADFEIFPYLDNEKKYFEREDSIVNTIPNISNGLYKIKTNNNNYSISVYDVNNNNFYYYELRG